MRISTSRFGPLEIHPDAVIRFPAGLPGLEDCRGWVLLGWGPNDAVAWLQNVERPEVALPVVSPRRFLPDYRVRIARRDLAAVGLSDPRAAKLLAIVGKAGGRVTLNLRAPLVMNLEKNLGRQVVTKGDLPVQFELAGRQAAFRHSA